jgi:cytidyltransferase-like protein
MNKYNKKYIMVFGVFDGFHEGHRYFLNKARIKDGYLIVVVARDEYVERKKKRFPCQLLKERMKVIKEQGIADEVCSADSEDNSWNIIKEKTPDIIALGYDQNELEQSIKNTMKEFMKQPCIVRINAYKPEKYKSSIIHKKKI